LLLFFIIGFAIDDSDGQQVLHTDCDYVYEGRLFSVFRSFSTTRYKRSRTDNLASV
jgi:hypothetical protein